MKVIIAGSRDITDIDLLEETIARAAFYSIVPSEVVSGGARGVDSLGEQWAIANKIKLTIMNADWYKYGRKAGYLRNVSMANYVAPHGALIALWDGESSGTALMIKIAKEKNIVVLVRMPKDLPSDFLNIKVYNFASIKDVELHAGYNKVT